MVEIGGSQVDVISFPILRQKRFMLLRNSRGSVSDACVHFATGYGGAKHTASRGVGDSQVNQREEGSVQRQQHGGGRGAASSSGVCQEVSRCQSCEER